jgi:hypothetical protein
MFAAKSAQKHTAAPSPGVERRDPTHPVNPAWQALATSTLGGRSSSGDGTIRRSVPVNVPHPGNLAPEEEDEQGGWSPFGRLFRALKVGRSDDPMEVEAEAVADRVMRSASPAAAEPGSTPARSLTPGAGGQPLAPATRTFFEPRLGVDLGGVRLHTGPEEATAAARLNARAFAYGGDIWLGAGEREGDRRLMAHELTHVLQASDPGAAPRLIRRYTRTNTLFLHDLYVSKGSDPANVTDDELRTTIEYEDYGRADLVWRFSDTVALGALRRSMDLFVAGVRGRRPNYIRSGQEARSAAHGLETVQITELGFTGDHLLTSVPSWGAAAGPAIDAPDGSAPTWSLAGIDLPVAYTKGTPPTMFARFLVTPAMATPVPAVQLRARAAGAVIGTASGLTLTGTALEGSGTPGQVAGIGGGAAVPGSGTLGKVNTDIAFDLSTDGGRVWFQAGTAPARFFFTEATPTPPGGVLREDALEIVMLAATLPPLPDELAGLVGFLVTYDPSVLMPPSFATSDAVMGALKTPHQCDSQAFLMRYLLMSVGINADVDYFWRGSATTVMKYHFGSQTFPSYQYDRPKEDSAVAQPHFFFHALTNVGGQRFDPTYGQASMGGVLESAPGASDQFGSRATFLATSRVVDPWKCPH